MRVQSIAVAALSFMPSALVEYRGVVIAEDGDGATLDMRHDRVEHPAGIGAVADIVAEEDVAFA